ncbi:hypothetical protein COT30_03075 [Candidatus Micrarchaeota archaeon CG08_land_8_20_14_0_20_49_17]|nr:MAG: hypothetical protein COT30_03075 [Candidatus Micrarchaeota archaeon CG08_land_8_20_14_0_20_49_17]
MLSLNHNPWQIMFLLFTALLLFGCTSEQVNSLWCTKQVVNPIINTYLQQAGYGDNVSADLEVVGQTAGTNKPLCSLNGTITYNGTLWRGKAYVDQSLTNVLLVSEDGTESCISSTGACRSTDILSVSAFYPSSKKSSIPTPISPIIIPRVNLTIITPTTPACAETLDYYPYILEVDLPIIANAWARNITINKSYNITAHFMHKGPDARGKQYSIRFYTKAPGGSWQPLGERQMHSSMSDNQVYQLRKEFTPTTPGRYELKVALDEENAICETNESNNVRTASISVVNQPRVDFAVRSIRFLDSDGTAAPSPATTGLRYWVNASVVNSQPDSAPIEPTIYWKGPRSQSWDVLTDRALYGRFPSSGNGRAVDVGWTFMPAEAGRYEFRVVIDERNIFAETNENNNALEASLTTRQSGLPDLHPIVISLLNSTRGSYRELTLRTGNRYYIDVATNNIGTLEAGRHTNWILWMQPGESQWALLNTSNVVITRAGNQGHNIIPFTASRAGLYRFEAWIDFWNNITESNENNNVVRLNITAS